MIKINFIQAQQTVVFLLDHPAQLVKRKKKSLMAC